MKKIAVLTAMLLLGSLAVPANAFTITDKEMGYISVNTSASKEMAPDTAMVSFSVETTAKTSKAASDSNKEITTKLIGALKPLIEIDKNDTIQTQNLNLRPDYSYEKNKRTLTGYTMVNTITVKTNKLDSIPKLIDTAIANKATNVSELRYYVENESDNVGRLTQEAVAKAKIIAKLTADSMDTKIKGIKTINIVKNAPSDNNGIAMYAAKAQNSATTPVEPGKVKIQVNVYAQFYVK